ncbi:hypothetical protein NW759_002649 [Fusarium solani]|nr:hypothetical protein NW759_002649 [Fusarium solani]
MPLRLKTNITNFQMNPIRNAATSRSELDYLPVVRHEKLVDFGPYFFEISQDDFCLQQLRFKIDYGGRDVWDMLAAGL